MQHGAERDGKPDRDAFAEIAIAVMRAADPAAALIDGRQVALDALRIEDPADERFPALRALRLALIAAIEGDAFAATGRRA